MDAERGVRGEVGFIAPVEGLRGVAVLLVMLFHYAVVIDPRFADPWIAAADAWLAAKVVVRNGMLGVDLFFLITGFLLVLPWLRHAGDGRPAPSATAFYRRRIRRILPAYYVHLLILFFVLVPLLRGIEYWRLDPTHLFTNLSAHVFLVHYLSPVTSASVGVNGALWTLSLEAQFYLLLPLLAPAFARAPWRTALALFATALAWRWAASHALVSHFLQTQLPGYLGHFAAGMLCARAWLHWRDHPPSNAASIAWLALAACAGALLWRLHAPGGWLLGDLTWALVLAALATLLVALVGRGAAFARPLLANRALLFAGRVSYSAYLYHLPVILLWNLYAPAVSGSWIVFPSYIATVLAIAWLSYRYVEVPGMASAPASPREAPPQWPEPEAQPRPTGRA
jgi:peptidoglycan/LPS O-acetylase OafA/YrhL